jgi:formate hydrogenlyase subunit 3/multisubunit Na+/H+ antiporter MnhD subunit
MSFLLISVGLLLATALAAQLTRRSALLATAFGTGGAVAGCLTALIPVIQVLWTGQTQSLRWAWSAPYGSFYLEIDALSAFFLLPILILSA